mgnify:CR=1 FL=1
MKILFLCNKNYYLTKMSRVRFHSMESVEKITDFKWSGPDWEGYDNNLTVQENIDNLYPGQKPDIVVGYKPLDMKGFADVKQKTCIRYNEMYDHNWTLKEMYESRPNLIICHHENDMMEYLEYFKDSPLSFDCILVNIPHCAKKTIYNDQKKERPYDILLVGALGVQTMLGQHYPLRNRMYGIIQKMKDRYKCAVVAHPGGEHLDAYTDKYAKEFANVLNLTKIAVTCSGVPNSRYGKYIEIPMCGTAIAADLPGEDRGRFTNFVIEINMEMSDQEIVDKLSYFLDNEKERKMKVQIGQAWSQQHTQEDYARRFVEAASLL